MSEADRLRVEWGGKHERECLGWSECRCLERFLERTLARVTQERDEARARIADEERVQAEMADRTLALAAEVARVRRELDGAYAESASLRRRVVAFKNALDHMNRCGLCGEGVLGDCDAGGSLDAALRDEEGEG